MKTKYPIEFRAAVLEATNESLKLRNVTFKGPLQPGQVLVKVHYSGICGKQIEEIKASSGPDKFLPHMLGHEGSGVVADVGPGVSKVTMNDHVVMHWLKGSGIDAATPLYNIGDKRINAGWVTTFNEYAVVSENRVTKIKKDFEFDVACLLGCAVTTGVGTVFHDAYVKPNETVAVFGCGGVGLNIIQGAHLANAGQIIAVDINKDSLDLARDFGATDLVIGDDKVIENIKKLTDDSGCKHVFNTSGIPEVVANAVQASSMPGTVYFVGVPPADSTIQINPFEIHMLRTLKGSCGGGTYPDNDIPSFLELYSQGKIKLKELISHVVTLENINEGIDLMLSGKIGRCVVRITNE